MIPSGIITLLTDFGTHDPFVGVMKGVILQRFRQATLVDLCHEIAAQDIPQGGFWLARSYAWFPSGTVHVAVVDPGVGSDRAAVVVSANGHLFVAPDNGLCDGLFAHSAVAAHVEARRIDRDVFGLPEPSRTFHGRDVFAPVAADLASGRTKFDGVGPPFELERRLVRATPVETEEGIEGEVIAVDHFGNLITDIEATVASELGAMALVVAGQERPVRRTYADANVGECVAIANSFGTLELAVRQGHAASELGLGRGARIRIRKKVP